MQKNVLAMEFLLSNSIIGRWYRARAFADILAGAGLAATSLSLHAAGSEDPMQPKIDADNHAVNRRVSFAVRSATR